MIYPPFSSSISPIHTKLMKGRYITIIYQSQTFEYLRMLHMVCWKVTCIIHFYQFGLILGRKVTSHQQIFHHDKHSSTCVICMIVEMKSNKCSSEDRHSLCMAAHLLTLAQLFNPKQIPSLFTVQPDKIFVDKYLEKP